LEELKDKPTNAGKKSIVRIRRRAGQVLQREQRTDRNLRIYLEKRKSGELILGKN